MAMHLGAVFPQIETSDDIGAIDEYVAALVEIGLDHLLAFDHVVGADTVSRPGWRGAYSSQDPFHEPLTLFSYLAARCTLALMTNVLVLPQRQTVLVAKQAAEIDVLSRGRLRLGVGIGWNAVEYEALGKDFSTRGRRFDEQIKLLRLLWTQRVVDFDGEFEVVRRAGILPLPIQRPIPIWLGAGLNRRGLERVGRLADGFIPRWLPDRRQQGVGADARVVGMAEAQDALRIVREAAVMVGRDPTRIGIQGRIPIAAREPDWILEFAAGLVNIGTTHIAIDTMGAGLKFPEGHVEALRRTVDLLEHRL